MGRVHKLSVLSSLLVVASLVHDISATQYYAKNNAENTPGGARFDREIGVASAVGIMGVINDFVWRIFEQPNNNDRKNVPSVTLFISDFEGPTAYVDEYNNIYFSASAIQTFPPNYVKFYFASVLYHELAHIFQWNGRGTAPAALTGGIAEYVKVRSHIYDRINYPKPGSGSSWDERYGVTERFLEYCDGLRGGFTAALNKKMRYSFSFDYFQELLGKPLDDLWIDYKTKYINYTS